MVTSIVVFVDGAKIEPSPSQIVILSNFTGIGHISKGIELPNEKNGKNKFNFTSSFIAKKKKQKKICQDKYTPPAACGFRNADEVNYFCSKFFCLVIN